MLETNAVYVLDREKNEYLDIKRDGCTEATIGGCIQLHSQILRPHYKRGGDGVQSSFGGKKKNYEEMDALALNGWTLFE